MKKLIEGRMYRGITGFETAPAVLVLGVFTTVHRDMDPVTHRDVRIPESME